MNKYIKIYLIIINIVGISSMYIDKKRAIKRKRRIKEKTLINIALLGASVGSILGMNIFRHKTKHNKFKYGLPLILVVQLLIIYGFFYR